MRVTRNADIDADALYDEDLDYREFMVELIKKRKKLAPLRLELSRDMDDTIVKTLCNYLDLDTRQVFRSFAPLNLSFVFQLTGSSAVPDRNCSLKKESRSRHRNLIWKNRSCHRSKRKTSCFPIHLKV